MTDSQPARSPVHWNCWVWKKLSFSIAVVNKHNGTGSRKRKENKFGKEVEGEVSGVKSEGHMSRGRNRFPTEFITELGEGFVLI